MSIKPDMWIEYMARSRDMIEPFLNGQVSQGAVSHGLSSYGYDVSLASEFKIFTSANQVVIDPKAFDPRAFVEAQVQQDDKGIFIVAPPNSFVLGRTIEYMRIPRDTVGLMTVKSTYARCGLISPPTVLEPEWHGHITIEISNTSPLPARVYAYEGIAQVLFFQADEFCRVSYADRQGKYQGQQGVTLPQVVRRLQGELGKSGEFYGL